MEPVFHRPVLPSNGGSPACLSPAVALESKLICWLVPVILVFTTWAWGGMKPGLYAVSTILSAVLLGLVLTAFFQTRQSFLWRDPVFAAGLLFLAYLSLQWWNSGRVLYFDAGWAQWKHAPPPFPGLPSGFVRSETAQMIAWFFPPWVLALALRSPFLGGHARRMILRIVVWSGGLLALLGVVQFAAGLKAPFAAGDGASPFFASFGYTNHAAAFFLMIAALAAGQLYREMVRVDRPVSGPLAVSLGLALVLCLAGVNLSLSRAGVILSWGFAFFAAGFVLWRGWPVLSKVRRVKHVAASAGLLVALVLIVAGLADTAILGEFGIGSRAADGSRPGGALNLSMGGREKLRALGWRVWSEAPLFGVGGWGFRHRAAFQLSPEAWDLLKRKGWANVHCDPLQYAAEFGLVGSAFGLAALAGLLVPAFRAIRLGGSLMVLGGAGLALVAALSLIDIPFRCPAILMTWTSILAALPSASYPSRFRIGHPSASCFLVSKELP